MDIELIKQIEHLRKKMIYAALTKGFTSKESVRLSQELDCLLNLYNHYSNVHCAMAEIEQGNHEYEMTDSSG